MSIRDIYFSDQNLKPMAKYLVSELKLSKDSLNACRDLLLSQMKLIYEKNKQKIANKHSVTFSLGLRLFILLQINTHKHCLSGKC